jgi:choline dehydrogenase
VPEIGNSAALTPFAKREVMPGNLIGAELERFVRDAAMTYWHQTGTAKMGQDAMSVVDGTLKVHGIEHLRIADGSIMPRDRKHQIRSLSADRGRQISPLRSRHLIRTAPR